MTDKELQTNIAPEYQTLLACIPKHLRSRFSFHDLRGMMRAMRKNGLTAKQESPWVPIGEIPEEWKDGQMIDVWSAAFHEVEHGHKFNSDGILCDDFWNICELEDELTHAMLPPQPPKENHDRRRTIYIPCRNAKRSV